MMNMLRFTRVIPAHSGLPALSLAALLFGACNTNSPVEPATVVSPSGLTTFPHALYFDLDGSGTIDFSFSYFTMSTRVYPPSMLSRGLWVESLDSNQVQNSPVHGTMALQDNAAISDSIGWAKYSEALAGATNYSRWSGPFVGTTPLGIGFRLNRGGEYHYGWAKLLVNADDGSFSIVESACNAIADEPILCGSHPQHEFR